MNMGVKQLFILLFIWFCVADERFPTYPCPLNYKRGGYCEDGFVEVFHKDSALFGDCLKCEPKSCGKGYTTGLQVCEPGTQLVFSGFSGHIPCSTCQQVDCPEGYSTVEPEDCKTKTGFEIVRRGKSGNLWCEKCEKKECPPCSSINTTSCDNGYEFVTTGFSGSKTCGLCKKSKCPSNSFILEGDVCLENLCRKGYTPSVTEHKSGDDLCYQCVRRACPPFFESKPTFLLDDYCDPSHGNTMEQNGFSGSFACVRCVPTPCPPGFHKVDDTLKCNLTNGWQVITHQQSGGISCGKCVENPCPETFSSHVTCPDSGFNTLIPTDEENNNIPIFSRGHPCKKCIPKDCPSGFSPKSTLTHCNVSFGYTYCCNEASFRGTDPCCSCNIRPCPSPSHITSPSDLASCESEAGYIPVPVRNRNTFLGTGNHYSGGKICMQCVPKKCSQGWNPNITLSTCDASLGWLLEVNEKEKSGDKYCKRCLPAPCGSGYSTLSDASRSACARREGYEIASDGTYSGGRGCGRCQERSCRHPFTLLSNTGTAPLCPGPGGGGRFGGKGFDVRVGYSSGDAGSVCYFCEEKKCAAGYSVGITCESSQGWDVDVRGYSGEKECRRCVARPCVEGSEAGIVNCGRDDGSTESGWNRLDVGCMSGGKKCERCVKRKCEGNSSVEVPENSEGFYYEKVGMCGNDICYMAIPRPCAVNYEVRVPEYVEGCSASNGYVIKYKGYSGNSPCVSCMPRRCPGRSVAGQNCALHLGWDSIVRGNSAGVYCIECVSVHCPIIEVGVSISSMILSSRLRESEAVGNGELCSAGTEWKRVEKEIGSGIYVYSGGHICGYCEEICKEGFSLQFPVPICDEKKGERLERSGKSGRCVRCAPSPPCPENWKVVDEEVCVEENGYQFIKHPRRVKSMGKVCGKCEVLKCPKDMTTKVLGEGWVKVTVEKKFFSGGKECVKFRKAECDCGPINFAIHVRCPYNTKKECRGFSGEDECCRCVPIEDDDSDIGNLD